MPLTDCPGSRSQDSDGLQRGSGPGSLEAAYQAALRDKKMKENSSLE